jgi:hypothetical protein
MDRAAQMDQIDRNYDFFQRNLASYLVDHADEYALLRDERLIGFFKEVRDASDMGHRLFADGIYSIQEVTADPIDLGIFSHAGS